MVRFVDIVQIIKGLGILFTGLSKRQRQISKFAGKKKNGYEIIYSIEHGE